MRRILIVDDEQGIRAALGQLLEFEGYEVRAVANAVDGIGEYEKWKPHLVFMDVKMAGIDGLIIYIFDSFHNYYTSGPICTGYFLALYEEYSYAIITVCLYFH